MKIPDAIRTLKYHTARPSQHLPVLEAVHVTDDGYMEATDRFTLARAKLDDGHGLTPGNYGPDAQKILAAGGAASPDVDGDFPNVARLVEIHGESNFAAGPFMFDPAHLAKFAPSRLPKVAGAMPCSLTFTPGSTPINPYLVTVGGVEKDEWCALIVPRRATT